MKNRLCAAKMDNKLESLSKACSLGDYQNKISCKINKYFSQKSQSRLIITLRLLFFNFKSLFKFTLPYKSEYSDDTCHILLAPGGGIGDHIYFLKYCYCLKIQFQDTIKINVLLKKSDKFIKNYLYMHAEYIDSVFVNKSPKHDVVINLTRFPEIKNVDLRRVKLVCNSALIEYLYCISQFKLKNTEFYKSDYLGRCYSQIYKRTRENQADIQDFLKMSTTTDFSVHIDEGVVQRTLSKYGLSNDSYVMLQTGSGHHFQEAKRDTRQWPIEYYQKFIFLLRKNYPGLKFIQCGEPYHNHINNVDIDLVGKTSVEEAFALIKSAKLLISAEGGYPIIRHFTSRKISCVLFGPTNKDFFGFDENINISANVCPGCEWIYKAWYQECMISEGQTLCMKSLLPEVVAHSIEQEHVLK